MIKIIGTIVALGLVGIAGGAATVYSGVYDVAATAQHWPVTYRVLDMARIRSIKAHAEGIVTPDDLGKETRIVGGTSHFSEHCSICHSAPGVEAEDMAEGMYPKPPVLTDVSKRYTPAQLFWILQHGIKMSGMPSWGDHGDEALWDMVAFLEKLPDLTPVDYTKLVVAAKAAGGHHMHGGMNMGGMDMGGMKMSPEAPTGTTAPPSSQQH